MTYTWALELEEDAREVGDYLRPYVDAGALVSFVELYASLETRLERNRTEHRLAEKRSKRDVDWSDENVRQLEQHVMNTGLTEYAHEMPGERLLGQHRCLRLDNTNVSADETARTILTWLS
ncbi:hypothetical protein ACFQU3_19615 [Terrabacter sp. GCM10028922]|uniref:hypothetical protein n=1 Tax=Terrabacter sp. GCM10028922 TaxID=3273428 RepID=UPI00360ED116